MSFNAGAIQADLALGRSAWTRDLKKTRKEIADLEKQAITVGIDADDTNARVVMDNLEMMLEDLGRSTYTPEIDIDSKDANVRLSRLDDQLDELERRNVNIDINADTLNARSHIEALEAQLLALSDENINIDVDADTLNARTQLDILEAKMDVLSAKTVDVEADADITNAMIQLDILEDQMTLLDLDSINIEANADIAGAMAELGSLYDAVQAVDAASIDIDVDVDDVSSALAEIAALSAAVAIADAQSIDIDVDVDSAAMAGLVGAGGGGGGSLGLLKILLYAIILLSPVLAVAIGAMTAAIVGFVAALVGAAGAAVVLAGGLVGLVLLFKDTDPSEYTQPMQNFADAIDAVKEAYDGFLDSIQGPGFNLMADALDLVAQILPTLAPLFNAVAGAMSGVLGGIADFVNSSEYEDMIGFFSGYGVDMLVLFMGILGDLIVFFGRLFEAIAPFATQMMEGLKEVTEGWAEWADDLENNQAFQNFVDNAIKYGPMLLDMLGSLIGAFQNIGQAIEPIAGPMLIGLTFFFDLIANAPVDLLTAFVVGFAGLWLGFTVIAPLIGTIAGGIGALATALGIGVAPLLLIVGLAAGLAFALYTLWNESETFRTSVTAAFEAVRDTVIPIFEDIWAAVQDNWGPMKDWALETWDTIKTGVEDAVLSISIIVQATMIALKLFWDAWGQDIVDTVVWAFGLIGDIIGGAVDIWAGIFAVFHGLLTGDWDKMWNGVKKIVEGAVAIVIALFQSIFVPAQNAWGAVTGMLVKKWDEGVENVKSLWTAFRTWIGEKWTDFKNWFNGLAINPVNMWDAIVDKWIAMKGNIEEKWGNFKSWVSGWAVNLGELWDDAVVKWVAMKTDIEGKWTAFKTWASGLSVDFGGMWDGLVTGFKNAVNAVIGAWNDLSFSIPAVSVGGKEIFGGADISTPNVAYLAKGGYLTDPTLAVVGEAGPEIVAPEPILRRIVEEHSGSKIDYNKLAQAVANAFMATLGGFKGVTAEDLERLIEAASVNINLNGDRDGGGDLLSRDSLRNLMFELRRLGYGGPLG